MKKYHKQLNKAGFTLVEVLIAIVITLIIMVMIIYPFVSSTGYLAKARARAEVQQVAREALDAMSREISQAMDLQLDPDDATICAVLLPRKDANGDYLYPLTPELDSGGLPRAIRFWQVQRDDTTYADGLQHRNSGNSWYDQFQLNPDNLSPTQTGASFLARTVISNSLAINPNDSLLRGVSRRVPFPDDTASPTQRNYKDNIIAITPDEANFDIPVLRFTATPQVNETLQRDNSGSYVFKAKYPLWESNWSVTVYDSDGNEVTSFTSASASPLGAADPYNGKVSFFVTKSDPIDAGYTTINLTSTPILGSEQVTVDDQIYTRVSGTPSNNEYAITYNSGTSTWELTVAPAPTVSGTIAYQYTPINQTDIVTASYSTRALLNISLTASKRDTQSGLPQSISLQQKVKLKNVVR